MNYTAYGKACVKMNKLIEQGISNARDDETFQKIYENECKKWEESQELRNSALRRDENV